ncbi:TPA: hypothetical protein TVG22_001441 [Streptococcus equi subsp. zooepidemicus]|nr:hypothetical protein [Streptococcus equi subsp. zooepidemicus]HEL1091281.1 hypothetical protein [Streptococcus equi subsp. zooepidemicus]HEL1555647.1 hypothetical protein [Streptococcus equi subsp. zooepidemicus]
MKKKLVTIFALCAVGVSANVKAEVYGNQRVWGFRTNWQQGRDFGAKPINEGDDEIKVKTAPNAVLHVYKKDKEGQWKSMEEKITGSPERNPQSGNIETREIDSKIKFTVANGNGIATFYLNNEKPKFGDQYKLTLTIGGFYLAEDEWTVGESIPKDIEEKDEEEIQKFVQALENKEKEKADREQKYAEALFRNAIATEANKTWYQRLGDSIEDTWANVKGWWKG